MGFEVTGTAISYSNTDLSWLINSKTWSSIFLSLCFCLADLVLYCEAFLTTYRTFITPEDLIKKLHYRYPFQNHQRDTLQLLFAVFVFQIPISQGNSSLSSLILFSFFFVITSVYFQHKKNIVYDLCHKYDWNNPVRISLPCWKNRMVTVCSRVNSLLLDILVWYCPWPQWTYTSFCHSPDTFKKRVSKNTFFVLVRVVDELWWVFRELCLLRAFNKCAKGCWALILFSSSVSQFGGTDGGHPETADGPGVHAGVQRWAQPRPCAPEEHPGQGGAEEAAALH